MTIITIPASIAAAEIELDKLGNIATATEWHRAAIVATFVEIGADVGRPRNRSEVNSFESANAFARRGIVGLKSTATVLLYARAWLDRFPRPPIGARVDLPAEVWPPTRTGTDGYSTEEGAARTIARIVEKHGVDAVAKAVQADVNVRRAVRDAIDAGDREHDPRPPRITDRGKTADELNEDAYWVKVRAALHLLLDVKVKISQGVTVPGDIAILMELLVPETDWDEALRQEIGNLS